MAAVTGPGTPAAAATGVPTAARALVASMRAHGVDRVFCVAGESYLAVLNELLEVPEIDLVACRHEGSAAFAALADAKLTGRAGVCLVSRGPGATNAAIGVHAARQDATPLVLVVGQVRDSDLGREVFQEIDAGAMFAGLAKAVLTLHDADCTAEFAARAFRTAESGTPGPVILTIPENISRQLASGEVPGAARWAEDVGAPAPSTMAEVERLLSAARRPLLIAGGGLATPFGRRMLAETARGHTVPVVTSNKRQDLIDNRDPHYGGHLHNATPREQLDVLCGADLILAIGTRLDEVTTRRQRLPAAPVPRQPLIHVYPDPGRIGLVHRPTIGLACDPAVFLAELSALPRQDDPKRRAWVGQLHDIETAKAVWRPHPSADGVPFGAVVTALDNLTGGDVTVVVDSGTFTSWVYRYLRLTGAGRLLGVTASPMGFAVPAAVAAAMRHPDRPVVAVVGDGGFLMNGSELITAVAANLPVVVVVADNGSYATIRNHQEREYPGRVIGTDLVNPDFARLAEAYGALGLTVDADKDVGPALRRALDCRGPALVHVHTSLSWISAYGRLDRVAARRRQQCCTRSR
jgi:acetolactate synthase-1/2/3 large subunit